VKIDRSALIGIGMLATYVSLPLVLGYVPSIPRKDGHGWTPELDMHKPPARFWDYERGLFYVPIVFFAMWFLTRMSRKQQGVIPHPR
jgi:hypothetical protein